MEGEELPVTTLMFGAAWVIVPVADGGAGEAGTGARPTTASARSMAATWAVAVRSRFLERYAQ